MRPVEEKGEGRDEPGANVEDRGVEKPIALHPQKETLPIFPPLLSPLQTSVGCLILKPPQLSFSPKWPLSLNSGSYRPCTSAGN